MDLRDILRAREERGAVADVVEVAWTVRLQRSEFDADQAARSTGTVSAILSLSVCHPSTLRIVI
jgi:hypothetical protein